MSIYIQLFILCVAVSGSGYMGYLSGIHSKRNASYRKGFRAASKLYLNSTYGKYPDQHERLRRDIRTHNERIGL